MFIKRRYVPNTYNNGRFVRFVIGTVVAVICAALILFIALFFILENYLVTTPDGVRLEIPFLIDTPPEETDDYGYYYDDYDE